jgi:hypothetical protein
MLLVSDTAAYVTASSTAHDISLRISVVVKIAALRRLNMTVYVR